MMYRIMLAAALIAVPAIVVAERPAPTSAHSQQAETKSKKHGKKGLHKKGGKAEAPKAAAPDTAR